jgi:hypothetical protein
MVVSIILSNLSTKQNDNIMERDFLIMYKERDEKHTRRKETMSSLAMSHKKLILALGCMWSSMTAQ